MSGELKVPPADIASLGDDISAHLRHFSPGERVAIGLYFLSVVLADLPAADNADAQMLAALAMRAGMMERAA